MFGFCHSVQQFAKKTAWMFVQCLMRGGMTATVHICTVHFNEMERRQQRNDIKCDDDQMKMNVARIRLLQKLVCLTAGTVSDKKAECVCVFWEEADFSISSTKSCR